MSTNTCSVPGCVKNLDSPERLHLFPNPIKYPDRFKKWLFAVGGDILALDHQFIYKNRRVCHRHFEEKYWCRYHRISQIAVPRLNLPASHRTDSVNPNFHVVTCHLTLECFCKAGGVEGEQPSPAVTKYRYCDCDELERLRLVAVDDQQAEDSMKAICKDQTYEVKPHIDHSYSQPNKLAIYEDNDIGLCHRADVNKHVTVKSANDVFTDQLTEREDSPINDTELCPASEIDESMYDDDDDDVQVIEKPLLAVTSPAGLPEKSELHEFIVCNVCENEIVGYRYVCVECCDWDLCGQCEARAAHPQHYVLRVAHTREHEEVLRVVEAVRQTVRQARGELMSLQLEVSADEQRGGGAALDEDDDNKDHVRQSLGLSVASPGAPHDPLEEYQEITRIDRDELSTVDIKDKVKKNVNVSDPSDLILTQDSKHNLPGTTDCAVNIIDATRTRVYSTPKYLRQERVYDSDTSNLILTQDSNPNLPGTTDCAVNIIDATRTRVYSTPKYLRQERVYESDTSKLILTHDSKHYLTGTTGCAVNIIEATRKRDYSIPKHLRQVRVYGPIKVTSDVTDRLQPSILTRPKIKMVVKEPRETQPTTQPLQQLNSTQTTSKLSSGKYINVANIDKATFCLHQKKLFGLAKVKLKRLSGGK